MQELLRETPLFEDHPEFTPWASPQYLLALGVFDGGYFRDSPDDVPKAWTVRQENYFAPKTSFNKQQWIDKGWIREPDELGWFQWYLRFWKGRRLPCVDQWQIKRWNNFRGRHGAMLRHNGRGDPMRSLRHRQAHLHWACNPFPDVLGSVKIIL